MYFDSLTEIFKMGGHGAYVWFCFGLFIVVMMLNFWYVRSVARGLKKRYQRQPDSNQSASE